jgi:methyl-accepting chemotaxis protein
MNNWKIGTRIMAGFAAVIAIALTLGLFAYRQIGNISKSSTDISGNSLPSVYVIGEIQAGAEESMALILEHVISVDKGEMAQTSTAVTFGPGK